MFILSCTWQFYTPSEDEISYDEQGYKLGMHTIRYISKGIFKMWLLNITNFWPLVTYNEYWGQNAMAFIGHGYHNSMHANLGPCVYSWTSNEFQGKNSGILYH